MLRKDHPAARMIFDQVTADREELMAFATGLVSLTNAVLTGMHGMRLADRYLADVAGQSRVARSAGSDNPPGATAAPNYDATSTTRAGGADR